MTTTRGVSDDDLVAVVTQVGRAMPTYGGDLSGVERRVRRRRYRRTLTGALASIVVFGIGGAVVAPQLNQPDGLVVADGSVVSQDDGAGTRIPVGGWASNRGDTATVRSLVDGHFVEHLRLGKGESVIDVADTLDGWLYVLTSRATLDAAEDNPNVNGLSYPLSRIDDSGRLAWTRDVRVVGEYVRLVAASPERVVLRRWAPGKQSSLVEFDVASGAERRLATLDGAPVPGSFIGDRVVTTLNTVSGCVLVEIDTSGQTKRRLELPGCREALAVAAIGGPGRRGRIAVAYDSVAGDPVDVAVAVVDDEATGSPKIVAPPQPRGELLGIAWQSDGRLMAGFAGRSPATRTPLLVEFPVG